MKNLLIILLFCFYKMIFSLDTSVIATGYGPNRDIATKQALLNALEQVIGLYLQSETYVENYQTIQDNIYKSSQGYINSYEIIKQNKADKGYYVTIKAQIYQSIVKKDLQKLNIIISKLDLPRILIQPMGKESKLKQICLNGLAQVLTDGNLLLLDIAAINKFAQEQRDIAYQELNNKVAEYGFGANADYIVRVDITEDKGEFFLETELISMANQAVVTSFYIMDKLKGYKSLVKSYQAARQIGTQAGHKLYQNIIDHWQNILKYGRFFTLVIEGFQNYNLLLSIQKELKAFEDIESLKEIESGNQKTSMLLRYNGSQNNLKSKILSLFKSKKWIVRINRAESGRMFLKIVKS